MNKLRVAFLFTIVVALSAVFFSFFLPQPGAWTGTAQQFHIRLALALCTPAVHVLAALFFFLGLAGFKQEFRATYRLIAIGVIVIGFSLLASPIVTFFDLWDKWPMELGIPNLAFVPAVIVIFIGIRTFFRKFEVVSIWNSLAFNLMFVMDGIALVVLMPHKASHLGELYYDFGNALFALTVFSLIATASNIFVVRRLISPSYARVLSWLGGGLVFEALLVGTSLILKAFGIDTRVAAGGLQDFLLLAAAPYVISGYLFYRLTADIRTAPIIQSNATAVDIIVYVASLASNPKAVDDILDGLRLVTAHLQPGQTLSATDQATLGEVYLRLEHYLTAEEKLRSFTAPQLRKRVYDRFKVADTADTNRTFWEKLPLIEPVPAPIPA
jgi:hypothetical protein